MRKNVQCNGGKFSEIEMKFHQEMVKKSKSNMQRFERILRGDTPPMITPKTFDEICNSTYLSDREKVTIWQKWMAIHLERT